MEQLPIYEFCFMVGVDILFLGALLMIMLPFGIWRQAAFAVMKRNFVGYFSNPTGYVFLCLFVLLTSFAAFWPHEFFTTNLANFDQLNRFLPYIMLIFIPAITMSIWSEERRQGTDELLLTLPAYDFDIVIGKYFAAVLVFTVSLLFSQLSNYAVLISMTGGNLDSGLLFSTYLGYWFVGTAMLAVGMVASFLTNNLTIGFIFGVVFNAPLAFFSNADLIISDNQTVSQLFEWSLLQRFDPFGRGLISLPSICYFVGIAVIGIYLSLVLIGRRHWQGGKHGASLLSHFIMRTLFLAVTVVALVMVAQYSPANRLRLDVSRNKISTLSESTRAILENLNRPENRDGPPITIDAYVGSNIPSDFVQTKYDLVNLLREFDVMGGNRVRVNLHTNVEPFSPDAILAEKRFGIQPKPYVSESRGAMRREQVVLGAAFTCGLDRAVIDFFPYGTQVEYELVRSIDAVSQVERERIGFVETDVYAAGGVLQIPGQQPLPAPAMGIVAELKKQYDVDSLNIGEPLQVWSELDDEDFEIGSATAASVFGKELNYDLLIVIQPSKMSPQELENLIAAIKDGQPVLIFEDATAAQPSIQQRVRSTLEPRELPRQGSTETCNIQTLWSSLGIVMSGRQRGERFVPDIVWQKYNPYRRDGSLNEPERLVIDNLNRAISDQQISTANPATAGIEELVFDYCGAFSIRPDAESRLGLYVEPLVAARGSGKISMLDWIQTKQVGGQALDRQRGGILEEDFFLAARISTKEDFNDVAPGDVNCIYVTDVDLLSDEALQIRNSPIQRGIEYRYQNVEFVLNLVDSLTGNEDYIPIRNRRERYVTLQVVEETIREATNKVDSEINNYEIDFEQRMRGAEGKAMEQIDDLQDDLERMVKRKEEDASGFNENEYIQKRQYLEQIVRSERDRLRRLRDEMQNERNDRVRTIRLQSELTIQEIERRYKLAAVLIPPIPPLVLGLIVFTRRRLREREGISKARRLR